MLSKEDYLNYLDQMLVVENKMMNAYHHYSQQIDDQNLKNIFTQLSKEEREHAAQVEKLIGIIKENFNNHA